MQGAHFGRSVAVVELLECAADVWISAARVSSSEQGGGWILAVCPCRIALLVHSVVVVLVMGFVTVPLCI